MSGGTKTIFDKSVTPILMKKQMEVVESDAGYVLNKMKQLVGEFKGLYEHRLRCLELNPSENHTVLLQVSKLCRRQVYR